MIKFNYFNFFYMSFDKLRLINHQKHYQKNKINKSKNTCNNLKKHSSIFFFFKIFFCLKKKLLKNYLNFYHQKTTIKNIKYFYFFFIFLIQFLFFSTTTDASIIDSNRCTRNSINLGNIIEQILRDYDTQFNLFFIFFIFIL
jgi:hypothetical protein